MKTLAAWLYESFPVLQEWFPIPALFLLSLYALFALIGLAIAAGLFWKWFHSGLDGIPDPVHPVIQRVVVVHEHRHSRAKKRGPKDHVKIPGRRA